MDKVNFTAKMDISSIKNNTNRWVNIAKTFEKHTREYPFDTFKVSETPNGIDILNINSKTKQDALVNFENENLKELLSITDIAIVQRFKNLLSLFKKVNFRNLILLINKFYYFIYISIKIKTYQYKNRYFTIKKVKNYKFST